MIDLDSRLFLNCQVAVHAQVLAGLIVRPVEGRTGVPPQPDAEPLVKAPGVLHQLLGCQVLLCFALVEVEHEEVDFLGHLGDDRQVDHLVLRENRVGGEDLLGLLRQEIVVDAGAVDVGTQEGALVDFGWLIGSADDLLIYLPEIVLEDGVVLAHGEVAHIAHQVLHDVGGELAGGRREPVHEHGQFALVFPEVFNIGLPPLVVVLLVQGRHLLLNLFENSLQFFLVLGPLLGRNVNGLNFLELLLDNILPVGDLLFE